MDTRRDEDTGHRLFTISETGQYTSFPVITGGEQLERFAKAERRRRMNPEAPVTEGYENIEVLIKIPSVRLQYVLGGLDRGEMEAGMQPTVPLPNHPVSRVNGAPLILLQIPKQENLSAEQRIKSPTSTSSAPRPNIPTFNTVPIPLLRIGAWLAVPSNEGDMLAKFDFRSKKVGWEILEENRISRHKIEIDWSNITAIQATMEDGRQGVLQLQLQNPPRFYKLQADVNPQRQHRWRNEPDFTNGRASRNRRHFLILPPGAVDGYYKRMMKNKHLLEVSKRSFPTTHISSFPPG